MDMLDTISQIFDHITKVAAGVDGDHLDRPTPCSEWDVRALLSHTVGFVNDDIRRFAGFYAAVPVAGEASLTDQLVAFVGRQP